MTDSRILTAFRTAAWAAAFIFIAMRPAGADQAVAAPDGSTQLHARFASLKNELGQNQFHRPLYMESNEGVDGVKGEIDAVVNHPFATAGPALNQPYQWCDILILHLNTKYCRASTSNDKTILHVIVGKKFDQPLADAYRVDFMFQVSARTATYQRVTLRAAEGPLGSSDYLIVLEAAPSDDGRTIVHLAYSYSFGMAGRLATLAYLGTAGRNKVGFTVVGAPTDGLPQYIGGIRGVVERNTMRYYLAIEAFLGALSVQPKSRMEKSLLDWFAASERFPRQLHEMEQGEYMAMKRKEYARQNVETLTSLAITPGEGG
jgi:hypothetical protein